MACCLLNRNSERIPRSLLRGVFNRVSLGNEEIVIEWAGKKIACLSPVGKASPKPKGKLDFRKAAGLGKEIWEKIDIAEYLQEERPDNDHRR